MGLLCRLFGKSWQAYYQYRNTLGKEKLKEEMAIQFVKDIRQIDHGIGGAKHIWWDETRWRPSSPVTA